MKKAAVQRLGLRSKLPPPDNSLKPMRPTEQPCRDVDRKLQGGVRTRSQTLRVTPDPQREAPAIIGVEAA